VSIAPTHVLIQFGSAIPASAQGDVMLAMEKSLRERGIPAEVFKETMGDDSKLRRAMTKEQRAKL
jgi:hypothetical protein